MVLPKLEDLGNINWGKHSPCCMPLRQIANKLLTTTMEIFQEQNTKINFPKDTCSKIIIYV